MSGTTSEPPAVSSMDLEFESDLDQSFAGQFNTHDSSYETECSLRPFALLNQKQDTRVVIFGRIVFKLKYRVRCAVQK